MMEDLRPLCFVLMPFGTKRDATGKPIDFDRIYSSILRPGIEESGLRSIRADEEASGGIIHKAMFERLLLCEYAVADLTTANANVYYELGVRHAVRPWTTVLVFADGVRLPFDLGLLRGLPYRLDATGNPAQPDQDRAALADRLRAAQAMSDQPVADSPVYALLDSFPAPDISRLRADTFRTTSATPNGAGSSCRAPGRRGPRPCGLWSTSSVIFEGSRWASWSTPCSRSALSARTSTWSRSSSNGPAPRSGA